MDVSRIILTLSVFVFFVSVYSKTTSRLYQKQRNHIKIGQKQEQPAFSRFSSNSRFVAQRKTFKGLGQHSEPEIYNGHAPMTSGQGWDSTPYEGHGGFGEGDGEMAAKEIVKFINRFLGVMGPFLFPLPYVLALIPLAIPAFPLSIWLESRNAEAEGHHPTEGGTGEHHSTSTSHNNMEDTMMHKPSSSSTTTPIHSLSSTTLGQEPVVHTTHQSQQSATFPNNAFQTTMISSGGSVEGSTGSEGSTSQNQTIIGDSSSINSSLPLPPIGASNGNVFPTFPINNLIKMPPPPDHPPRATLFPFPLFLNSSFLGPDYNSDDDESNW